MPGNVLITEAWRGLWAGGRAQHAYLYCLGFQCLAVLLWWPGTGVLAASRTPATLFAVLMATGVSLSYQSIRMGAEELMLVGQQSIREWLVSTRVPVWRLLAGYCIAHVMQTLHWMLLSAPVVLIAWSVGGTNWKVLGANALVMLIVASVYRIAGAIVYLLFGHYRDISWFSLRIILLLGFVAGSILSPVTSYWHVTHELLSMSYLGTESRLPGLFLLMYGLSLVVLYGIFAALALRIRSVQHRIET